jgi:S-adenosylmethionine hydrolase
MKGRVRHPIITLSTDFGLVDSYVAQMKGAILAACPVATIVDVTHAIARHDAVGGAFAVERALAAFPRGTVHVVVVDPGVGTTRRLLLVKVRGQTVLCPDNGLITWAWRRFPHAAAYELTWRPRNPSATFHGRDILAPVAAAIANGTSTRRFAPRKCDPQLLDLDVAPNDARVGQIVHIDTYGNATTNVPEAALEGVTAVRIGKQRIGLYRTYGDVPLGKALGLIGSSGLLEIAIREGSAADVLRLKVGTPVQLVR